MWHHTQGNIYINLKRENDQFFILIQAQMMQKGVFWKIFYVWEVYLTN